jgi:uncharacterized protein YcfJ
MKTLQSLVAVSMLGLAGTALAGYDGHSYTDWAKVTRVTPHYERVNAPRRECHTEFIGGRARGARHEEGRSIGGAVIGGITGGIVGNQVGRGDGRTAATAVGAVVGAIVGDRIDNGGYRTARHDPGPREIQRCRDIDQWDDHLTGYQVEYVYHGRRYAQFMREEPGRRIPVRVSVTPG